MSNIRNHIEAWFENFAKIIFDHRYKTLLIILTCLTLLFITQLPKRTIDTSTEGFLHENDPALTTYQEFRDQFGRDEMVIIAFKPENVFDLNFLKKLKALHEELKTDVPYLEEITSLVNARNTRGVGDELIVEDLLENWPKSKEELEAIKKRALSNDMYKNMLISEDSKFTTMIIQTRSYSTDSSSDDETDDFSDEVEEDTQSDSEKTYITDEQNSEVIRAVEKIVSKYNFQDTEVYIAGSPVVSDFLKRTMVRDTIKFMKIVVLTISVFLFIMFRRISGVIFPLIVVLFSLASTVSLMAATGTSLKLPTQILPSFILAVGVGDSVHILVIFFMHFNKHGDKREAISHALGHSGLAVFMTSLTTAGGLLSFSTAAVAPIADLGIFSSIGVLLAFIFTIILLPVLISIVPLKPKSITSEEKKDTLSISDILLTRISSISIKHPHSVLFIATIVIAFSLVGVMKINVSHNPMKWLPDNNPGRVANEKIDDELKGSTSLEVVIDTKKKNGLYNPEILNNLEKSADFFNNYTTEKVSVGKAWSVSTVLKETNQALHENDKSFYKVPQTEPLIAQEFFLFENSGSDDLEDFTDNAFSKARFTIKVPFIDAIAYTDFIKTAEEHFKENYPDSNIEMTGMVSLFTRVISSAIDSMMKSYGYALVIITLLMIFLIGKFRIGLLSMIPNITPIIIIIGIMGWVGIPMDLFCMLVGSIAIGLAVDDTIHFMHNFRRYFEESNDAEYAVKETLLTTGKAMLVTTCVLSIGFFAFMFADMKNLINFGFLTGSAIILALISDYFIAPALMIVANRRRN